MLQKCGKDVISSSQWSLSWILWPEDYEEILRDSIAIATTNGEMSQRYYSELYRENAMRHIYGIDKEMFDQTYTRDTIRSISTK